MGEGNQIQDNAVAKYGWKSDVHAPFIIIRDYLMVSLHLYTFMPLKKKSKKNCAKFFYQQIVPKGITLR